MRPLDGIAMFLSPGLRGGTAFGELMGRLEGSQTSGVGLHFWIARHGCDVSSSSPSLSPQAQAMVGVDARGKQKRGIEAGRTDHSVDVKSGSRSFWGRHGSGMLRSFLLSSVPTPYLHVTLLSLLHLLSMEAR